MCLFIVSLLEVYYKYLHIHALFVYFWHGGPSWMHAGEQGLLFTAVHGLLIVLVSHCRARALGEWASVVAACGLRSCSSWA